MVQATLYWYSIDGFHEGSAPVSIKDGFTLIVPSDSKVPDCIVERAERNACIGLFTGSAQDYSGPDVHGYEWYIALPRKESPHV